MKARKWPATRQVARTMQILRRKPGQKTDRMRPPVHRLVLVQLGLTLAMAIAGYLMAGLVMAYSALLGGLTYTLPNALFTQQVFRYRPARAIGSIVKAFYRGEVVKLVLTALCFAAVFKWADPLDARMFFITFILVLLTNSLAPALWGSKSLKLRA